MDILETNPELHDLMQSIMQLQYTDMEQVKQLCLTLRSKAAEFESDFAACFAENYLADYMLTTSSSAETFLQLEKAYAMCEKAGYESLQMQVYNLYGILHNTLSNQTQAAEYFVRGLLLSERSEDLESQTMFLSNLGDMFLQLHQYEQAMSYFTAVNNVMEQMPPSHRRTHFYLVNETNIADAQLHLNKPEKVVAQMDRLVKLTEEGNPMYTAALSNKAMALYRMGETEQAQGILDSLTVAPGNGYDAQEVFFYTLYNALFVATELCDAARMEAILMQMEHSPFAMRSLTRRRQIAEQRIRYCEMFGTPETLQNAYREAYVLRTQEEEHIAHELAQNLELKVNIYRMQQQMAALEKLSELDELTQLQNRRSLNHHIYAAHRKALRDGTQLGIIIFDVDHFKECNDTHGHIVGDSVICIVADALRAAAGDAFFAARYGGDEFVSVCEGLTDAKIDAFIARTVQELSNRQKELPAIAADITLSAGYCNALVKADITPERLLHRADKALYAAKETGRNRSVNAKDLHGE